MLKSSKIKTIQQLEKIIPEIKRKGLKIVLTHGVFDLIHWGHIHYLKEAKKLGDVLVVSLIDDKFVGKGDVKKLGPKRPIFKQNIRLEWLSELESVDYVALSKATGPWKVMKAINPDIYAKGSDSKHYLKDKNSGLQKDKELIKNLKGKLVFTKSLPFHTTSILKEFDIN